MADDPSIQWHLASPFGIEKDQASNAWHSGHVNDLIRFDDAPAMVVATESGGVWLVVDDGADPLCLSSEWDVPDVRCLAMGPDGKRHVFAGCTVAYDGPEKRTYKPETGSFPVIMETDPFKPVPLLEWAPINGALPADAGQITRIVVVPGLRRIVVACATVRNGDTGGIFWAKIPQQRSAPGDPPPAAYAWTKAKVSGASGAQGFWDLALAATNNQVRRGNLEDRRLITLVASGFRGGGLVVGQWDATDNLVFGPSFVTFPDNADATALLFGGCGTASVASCEAQPSVLYAAIAWPDGRLNSVVKSGDGGRTWGFCDALAADADPPLLLFVAGQQGATWNNCIAVHAENSKLVALGWQGGTFLSFDSGGNWRVVNGGDHLHEDVHTLHFAPGGPGAAGFLFVGSDGGVASINLDDLAGANGPPIRSDYNRMLPTLQINGPKLSINGSVGRQFDGSLDGSVSNPGIVAIGVQDNGNLSCRLRPTNLLNPWRTVDGADGGFNAFVASDGYLHNWNSDTEGAVRMTAVFGPPIPFDPNVQVGVVPVALPDGPDPNGLVAWVLEAVTTPTFRNASGQLLVATAAKFLSNELYGCFTVNGRTPPFEWRLLGNVPSSQFVSAVASFGGDQIIVGTAQGKMYRLDSASGAATEQKVVLPKPSPSTKMSGGLFSRIVGFDGASLFASLIGASEVKADGMPAPGAPATQGFVLKLEGDAWKVTAGSGLPNEIIYGLVAVATPNDRLPRALLAATDDAVFISRENADTWQRASAGLPKRAHCSDLRFVIDRAGSVTIYLGTFGRSLWMADLA